MGLLTQKDSTLYRSFFKEMAHLRGIPVIYRYVKKFKDTIHAEVSPADLSDPININVIFEENPKVKTLRRIGWVSESPDDKPYIMYFPFDVPHLTNEARVEIPMIDVMNNRPRLFKVTSITQLIEFPDALITTIVPVVDTIKPRTEYKDSNYNYINDTHKIRQ